MSIGTKIKHELKVVAIVTSYFLLGFGFVLVVLELFLAEHQIQFAGIAKAAVSALIAGKVVVVVGNFGFMRLCERRKGWIDVLYRTGVYTVATGVVILLEHTIEAMGEAGSFGAALRHGFETRNGLHVVAVTLLVGGLYVGYNVIDVLVRRRGKDVLLATFFGDPPPAGI